MEGGSDVNGWIKGSTCDAIRSALTVLQWRRKEREETRTEREETQGRGGREAFRTEKRPQARGERRQGKERRQVEALAIIRGAPELLVAPDGYARFSEPEHAEVHSVQFHTGAWSVTTSERPGGPSGT